MTSNEQELTTKQAEKLNKAQLMYDVARDLLSDKINAFIPKIILLITIILTFAIFGYVVMTSSGTIQLIGAVMFPITIAIILKVGGRE